MRSGSAGLMPGTRLSPTLQISHLASQAFFGHRRQVNQCCGNCLRWPVRHFCFGRSDGPIQSSGEKSGWDWAMSNFPLLQQPGPVFSLCRGSFSWPPFLRLHIWRSCKSADGFQTFKPAFPLVHIYASACWSRGLRYPMVIYERGVG